MEVFTGSLAVGDKTTVLDAELIAIFCDNQSTIQSIFSFPLPRSSRHIAVSTEFGTEKML
ncbi:hypothetical protein SCLCIDRAFT_1209606 [Scleroderma citrinum Foug A]|uniref:Uncharacterized protein n=1 Tax=Scleroderma citrinum Foug A TaxID=1036808 RepID=A0A0C3A3H3_9AGAM|nr:hypothetical protein SCLCIDRAFT_1209606 [Scleroderma citrinum Foug A]